jgi:hypothetical protein
MQGGMFGYGAHAIIQLVENLIINGPENERR